MERPFQLEPGKVYRFHTHDLRCHRCNCLWGVCGISSGSGVWLEAMSRNLHDFVLHCRLPDAYRFCCPAERDEALGFESALAAALDRCAAARHR